MRVLLTISACVLLLGSTGCIIPLPSKVSRGHRYSRDSLALLDLPGTTRDEVIASLGPPLLEHESRILLYDWEQTPRYLAAVPHLVHRDVELRGEVVRDYPERFGLFIAYDARGVIEGHVVQKIRAATLQEACVQWQKHRERER
jgi:hypothetical protein